MDTGAIVALVFLGVIVVIVTIHFSQSYINVEIDAITSEYLTFTYGIFKHLQQKVMASDIKEIIILYGSFGYIDVIIKRKPMPDRRKRKSIRFGLRYSIFKNTDAIFQNPFIKWFFHGRSGAWEMQIAYELSAVGDIYLREWGRFWEKPKKMSREKLKELADK
ncbi:MAG TPA: hypothetical protein VF399_09175 [bacterium]